MKKRLAAATKNPVFERFVALLDQFDREKPDLLRVLTYHRVDEPSRRPDLNPSLLSATPESFEQQMAFIQECYTPVSAQDVLAFYDTGQPLPERAIMVTVDDAYADFKEHIAPIAKKHDIPLTLFVPTDYPDNPVRRLWWDQTYHAVRNTRVTQLETPFGTLDFTNATGRKTAFKKLRTYVKSLPHQEAMNWVDSFCAELGFEQPPENVILGWDALRSLADDGVVLAAHTRTHPMLNRLSLDDVRAEITESRRDLEQKLGSVLPIFAYPSGGISDDVVTILQEEGFRLAFTTERGINNLKTQHPLRIKRINVGQVTTIPMLRLQCLPSAAYIFNLL